jgi:polysaccharide biosynthesis/export protein
VKLNHTLLASLLVLLTLFAAGIARANADYLLAAGDLVRVTVYDHADLVTETRVSEQGSILFPLVGEISVAGYSASQAAGRIAKMLEAGGFLRNPQVNLVVLEFKGQEVSVLGRVNRPGKFPLQKASRLTDILAMAGGATIDGADTLILISGKGANSSRREIDLIGLLREGRHELNVDVTNDDVLYIPREPRFYIYGEVQRPGAFRLERNMSLVQALSLGGGLTTRGTQKGIRILRRDDSNAMREINANLGDLLQPDDVVFVRESLF